MKRLMRMRLSANESRFVVHPMGQLAEAQLSFEFLRSIFKLATRKANKKDLCGKNSNQKGKKMKVAGNEFNLSEKKIPEFLEIKKKRQPTLKRYVAAR